MAVCDVENLDLAHKPLSADELKQFLVDVHEPLEAGERWTHEWMLRVAATISTQAAALAEWEWRPIEDFDPEKDTLDRIVSEGDAVGEARYYGEDEGWRWAGNDPTDSHGWRIYPDHHRALPAPPTSGAT